MNRVQRLLEAYSNESNGRSRMVEVAKDLKSLLDSYNSALQYADDADPGDPSDQTFKALFKAINSLALVMRSAAEYHGAPDRAIQRLRRLASKLDHLADDLES